MTDTDIWKSQRWFRKLEPNYKLAWNYIKDQCNHAGIWNIDCTDLMEDLGIDGFSLTDFISATNTEYDKFSGKKIIKERLVILGDNFLWITGFLQFQYENKEGKVNAEAAPVKTALQILNGYGILEQALIKGYFTLIKGSVRAKDKDKDKDIDKDIVNNRSSIKKKSKEKIPDFNTMPLKSEFGDLPEQYIISSKELVYRLHNKLQIESDTVTGLWEVFKTQHLTGHNHYPNEGKVYSHFINTIKTIKFSDGKGTNKGNTGNSPSQAREQARRDY